MRAGLHEPGPVRGVLHAVGEDQRLLLGGVEVSSPNSVDSDTDSRVAIALPRNRMPSAAPQAGQVSSLDSLVGVRADQGEHRQHPAVATVGARRSRCGARQFAVVRRENQRRPFDARLGAPAASAGARDQRPEPRRAGGVVAPDRRRR